LAPHRKWTIVKQQVVNERDSGLIIWPNSPVKTHDSYYKMHEWITTDLRSYNMSMLKWTESLYIYIVCINYVPGTSFIYHYTGYVLFSFVKQFQKLDSLHFHYFNKMWNSQFILIFSDTLPNKKCIVVWQVKKWYIQVLINYVIFRVMCYFHL
jgi:hypothetical protein